MTIVTLSDKIKFIESVFGASKLARNSKNIDVRCPFCAPRDATKRKLSIRVDDDRNHCWTCGWRAHTLVPLVKRFSTRDKLVEYIDKFMPEMPQRRRCWFLSVPIEQEQRLELPKDFKLLALSSDVDPDVKAAKRYLKERGIVERDFWYFKLGTSDDPRWRRRVIVPSFDATGALNYFVGRAVDSGVKPKYDNPDVDKLPIIFNELNIDWSQPIVVCEGVFDMFKCGDNAVPLLGSDLSEDSALFGAIVTNNTPVILALDPDMWGTKTLDISRMLMSYGIDVRIVDTRTLGGDPGSVTRKRFKEAEVAAQTPDWKSMILNRLSSATKPRLGM